MNRSAILIRVAGLVGLVTVLVLIVASPVGAFPFLAQTTPEPSPRPTVTPAPALELIPSQGVAGNANDVTALGSQWQAGLTVSLYWDVAGSGPLLGQAAADGDGRFQISFKTPTDPSVASVGVHTVIAVQDGSQATASYELIQPTPTNTPLPTDTNTPVTPSVTPSITPTPTATQTPIPSPTLRPVTPMVTISPIPPTKAPPKPPAATRAPTATRTNTPPPGPPTQTPVPTQTPGPGTPSATPQATPTPVEEMSDTGGGWGMVLIWGFVLGGLLLVFRMLRVRSLAG